MEPVPSSSEAQKGTAGNAGFDPLSESAALEHLFDYAFERYRSVVDSFSDAYEEEDAHAEPSSSGYSGQTADAQRSADLIVQLLGSDGFKELEDAVKQPATKGGTRSPASARSETVARLTLCFKGCARAVERLSLFSAGEEWDEIATRNLRYLLLPYVLGRLSLECADIQQRLHGLKEAQIFFREFMADMERLGVCRRDDVRAFDAIVDALQQSDASGDSGSAGVPFFPVPGPQNPAARRDELVARAKFEKEIDTKIAALLRKRREAARRGRSEDGEDPVQGIDDEEERDFWASLLSRAAAEAVTQMGLIIRELPLLTMRLQDEERRRGGSETSDSRLHQPRASPVPGEASRKPWVYTIKDRSDLRRLYREKVFTPGHNLPTMSLAECAAIEMEMEVNQIGAAKPKVVEQYTTAQARVAREEAKELEERAWDDWKDDNPRGSGNKMTNKG
uniref:TAP42 family protein n=1 Tax=Neospora caninum (strain Liverpool) TaxID=572307 RepID=A0A0F7UNC2_NEOCL|nr:TPA: TAP42 family protein [Neospora caninum Liverpool]